MAESLYSMLSKMLLDKEVVKSATKKAREKVKKSYDTNVRQAMIQYYLDSYNPLKYKRINPSPLFLAYKTRSELVDNGLSINFWVERTGVDISDYYQSHSYYHQEGDVWKSVSDIHSMTGAQYRLYAEDLREEYESSNGVVQGSWILKNFEAGIHPRTNGWPRKKYSRKMKYMPKRDSATPLNMLDIYANEFSNLDMTYQYIYSEMFKEWKKKF